MWKSFASYERMWKRVFLSQAFSGKYKEDLSAKSFSLIRETPPLLQLFVRIMLNAMMLKVTRM